MEEMMLQNTFEGRYFNIDGAIRQCYYCTYEGSRVWFSLHTLDTDNCHSIDFIVDDREKLKDLYYAIVNKESISATAYGTLHKRHLPKNESN
jgi:hypothetical protein